MPFNLVMDYIIDIQGFEVSMIVLYSTIPHYCGMWAKRGEIQPQDLFLLCISRLCWLITIVFLFSRYREDGHTVGEPPFQPPNPIRLQWDIAPEVSWLFHSCRIVWNSSDTRKNSAICLECPHVHTKLYQVKAQTQLEAYLLLPNWNWSPVYVQRLYKFG